jgi:hypothetical protein
MPANNSDGEETMGIRIAERTIRRSTPPLANIAFSNIG